MTKPYLTENEVAAWAWQMYADAKGEAPSGCAYRWAFVEALELRGLDMRRRNFKFYDAVQKYMQIHWAQELG